MVGPAGRSRLYDTTSASDDMATPKPAAITNVSRMLLSAAAPPLTAP